MVGWDTVEIAVSHAGALRIKFLVFSNQYTVFLTVKFHKDFYNI